MRPAKLLRTRSAIGIRSDRKDKSFSIVPAPIRDEAGRVFRHRVIINVRVRAAHRKIQAAGARPEKAQSGQPVLGAARFKYLDILNAPAIGLAFVPRYER